MLKEVDLDDVVFTIMAIAVAFVFICIGLSVLISTFK